MRGGPRREGAARAPADIRRARSEEELAEAVASEIGRPLDKWSVAAFLESAGLRDEDAREKFGRRDLFELSERIYPLALKRARADLPAPSAESPAGKVFDFLRLYFRGLLFAMPMMIQILAIIFLHLSLWAWEIFTRETAAAVALGTIASFIVTGGFVQAIGRRGRFYVYQGDYISACRICYSLLGYGSLLVALLGELWVLANLRFKLFPLSQVRMMLPYYFLLSELWLLLSILYMLERRGAVLLAISLPLLPVYLIMKHTELGMLCAHSIGLAIADLIAFLWGYVVLRRQARRAPEKFKLSPPVSFRLLLGDLGPYFCYGTLYFLLLFLDRLIAWSARTPEGELIWFRPEYELGMDWALLVFIFSVAAIEYSTNAFSSSLISSQKKASGFDLQEYIGSFLRFFRNQNLMVLGIAALSGAGAAFLLPRLLRFLREPGLAAIFTAPELKFAFIFGAISYGLLALGLLSVMFLFSLSRPQPALRGLLLALALDFCVGAPLSRLFGYEYGAVGLLCGSLAFAAFAGLSCLRIFRALDYYYYAAY